MARRCHWWKRIFERGIPGPATNIASGHPCWGTSMWIARPWSANNPHPDCAPLRVGLMADCLWQSCGKVASILPSCAFYLQKPDCPRVFSHVLLIYTNLPVVLNLLWWNCEQNEDLIRKHKNGMATGRALEFWMAKAPVLFKGHCSPNKRTENLLIAKFGPQDGMSDAAGSQGIKGVKRLKRQ